LILGAAGLVRVLALGRTRLLFPIAGTAMTVVILGTALLFPGLLGPAFLLSRAKEAVDPAVIRVVPLSGRPGGARTENPEWADASRAALQQGGTNLQVISASVRRVGSKSPSTNKIPPGDYHFIRVRTQQVDAVGDSAAKHHSTSASAFGKAAPRLTDSTGKDYRLCDVQEIAALPNERRPSVFPVDFLDQVLVFEAPTRPGGPPPPFTPGSAQPRGRGLARFSETRLNGVARHPSPIEAQSASRVSPGGGSRGS
jgi:hypothetical protein